MSKSFKKQAEELVRQTFPELNEESWKWAKVAGLDRAEEVRSLEIIGHPILLNHWLRLLPKHGMNLYTTAHYLRVFYEKVLKVLITFDLVTGQPKSEEDYQKIVELIK